MHRRAEEARLRSAYDEYKNDEDAVELITEHMPNRNDSSIRHKLRKLGLEIKDPAKWTAEEDQQLLQAYAQYQVCAPLASSVGSASTQGDRFVFVIDAIVARDLFAPAKNTPRKLLNRLKKLGITVEKEAKPAKKRAGFVRTIAAIAHRFQRLVGR